MSASLRDRRVKIYRHEDSGGQGLVSARYVFSSERWALLVERSAHKAIVGAAPNEKIDAAFDFDPAVSVEQNDLLVEGSAKFFCRGRTVQRNPPALVVFAERISEEVYQSLTIADASYSTSIVES